MLVHPIYERLLDRFCEEAGLDARAIRAMVRGERDASPETVDMLFAALEVPRTSWARRRERSRPALVSRAVSRHAVSNVTPQERNAILRDNGRRRRRYSTRVHEVLDLLDWTVAELAKRVSEELGRDVSRPSMQFYSTGRRQLGPKGASKAHKSTAPIDVREAAEIVTARAAQEQGKGAKATLRANEWPNVIDQ